MSYDIAGYLKYNFLYLSLVSLPTRFLRHVPKKRCSLFQVQQSPQIDGENLPLPHLPIVLLHSYILQVGRWVLDRRPLWHKLYILPCRQEFYNIQKERS